MPDLLPLAATTVRLNLGSILLIALAAVPGAFCLRLALRLVAKLRKVDSFDDGDFLTAYVTVVCGGLLHLFIRFAVIVVVTSAKWQPPALVAILLFATVFVVSYFAVVRKFYDAGSVNTLLVVIVFWPMLAASTYLVLLLMSLSPIRVIV